MIPILVLAATVGLFTAVTLPPKESAQPDTNEPRRRSESQGAEKQRSKPHVAVIRQATEAYKSGRVESAVALLEGYANESEPSWSATASMATAFCIELQQLDRAGRNLQTALRQDPSNVVAWRQQLEQGLILSDPAIASDALNQLHQLRAATPIDLMRVISGDARRFEGQAQWYLKCTQNEPDCLAAVAQLIRLSDDTTATQLSREYHSACEQSLLLACAVAREALQRDDLPQAVHALVPFAKSSPKNYHYWLLLSRVFRLHGDIAAADNCLEQAVALAPFQADVSAEAVATQNSSSDSGADHRRERWDAAIRLRRAAKKFLSSRTNAEDHARVARDLTILQLPAAAAFLDRRGPMPKGDLLPVNLTSAPMPKLPWEALLQAAAPNSDGPSPSPPATAIRFTDASSQFGVNPKHVNLTDDAILLSTLGSGIGAIDADGDHRPDLLFAQTASNDQSLAQTVVLLRRSFQKFDDVSANALPPIRKVANRFAHGICVGDFNNDGFDDFFLSCFGPDLLFRNNGDGTFSETELPQSSGPVDWSTSAVFRDLTGDGALDLFVTRYLDASINDQLDCNRRRQRPCLPANFEPATDKLFINDCTGSFINETGRLDGIRPAAGLGVEVGDFRGNGTIQVFVANDGHPNHFLSVSLDGDQTNAHLADSAFVQGVAVSAGGTPDACMGIALADFDHNEFPDLLVTNFEHEANNLYLADKGIFVDRARRFEIAQHSTARMGWGVAAADFNGDTFADVLLANSHLSDRPMPFEVMTNVGGLHFAAMTAQVDGSSFGPAMGRCVVTGDFDDDYRLDAVSSTLNGAAQLLLNRSNGRPMQRVRLVGRRSSRTDGAIAVRILSPDGTSWAVPPCRARGYMGSSQNAVFVPADCAIEVDWMAGEHSKMTAAQLSSSESDTVVIVEP